MTSEPLHRPSSPPPGRKTSDQAEEELRDKVAIEAMKKIMGYEAVAEYLQRGDESHTIGTKAVATSAYAIANEMMRARKEMT